MKIKSLLIAICFVSLMGSTYSANAETHCITVSIDCGNGTGTNTVACGETTAEIVKEAMEVADVVC
ncbi:hypothetical protein [Marinifilum sp. D714]|uniref:hypothetical protein n=1 Tax=Marinifilum sp. D714 TaxID=2937523 RepID=UPI0027C1AEEA|nr:hypothetical protein [Marinifilum sp. D714]MDQ2179541.1 hypothetical protein [Marinifilum sp. D714]